MDAFFAYTIIGLYVGAAYAIAASGLVLTYTTTRVFNLAHGATSMLMAFVYWQLQGRAAACPPGSSIVLVLFVIAPAFGVVLERVVMRGLGDAPVSVSLVVTVACSSCWSASRSSSGTANVAQRRRTSSATDA